MELMLAKYQPIDIVSSRVELGQALNNVKISSGNNPTKLFEQIGVIKNQYSKIKINEAELIPVVTNAVLTEYKMILSAKQHAKREELTLNHLVEAMNNHRKILGNKRDDSNILDGGREIALAFFGGYCFECKQCGHKQHLCPNKNRNNKCGKRGHRYYSS